MKIPTDKEVEAIRAAYPSGTRVQLIQMDDPQAPPIGTKGTVICVDDVGSLLVKWDNGSGMNVAYGEDKVLILSGECVYCATDDLGDSVGDAIVEKKCRLFKAECTVEQRIFGDTTELCIEIGNEQVLCERIKFNYCPMCGRRLFERK